MRFPSRLARTILAVAGALLLAGGCGARDPDPGRRREGLPAEHDTDRAGLLTGSTPKPHAVTRGGPYGPDLSPVRRTPVRELHAEAEGYTLALQQGWDASRVPTGVQVRSTDGTVGEIQRLATAPQTPAVRLPAGCRQEAQTNFPLLAGPGTLTQLHCAPTGAAAYDQVNVYFTSHGRHFFYWLRGRKSLLMKQADLVGASIDVLP